MNVFGSRPTKNTIEAFENVEPQDEVLTFEELKIKNAREWKYAVEEEKTYYSWHMKEKYQGKAYSIHLYSDAFQFLHSEYHSLGLLRGICVMPSIEIVYSHVKQAKNFVKIRYCLKVSKYNVQEAFTPFCE